MISVLYLLSLGLATGVTIRVDAIAEDDAARLELVRKGRELFRRLEREHRQARGRGGFGTMIGNLKRLAGMF